MSAVEPLCHLFGVDCRILSKEEEVILEADLFSKLCNELKIYFQSLWRDYSRLFKVNKIMEEKMLEEQLARNVIADILSSGEYASNGIAHYTQSHEDVILEIYEGRNTNPSSTLLRRIIELHRLVRPNLYKSIMRKIISACQAEEII